MVEKMESKKEENKHRITNVTAYVRLPARVDFYKTAKANPDLEYDEFSRYAWFPTLHGNGKIALSTSGISIMGARCEKEAREELQLIMDGRIKIVFAEPEAPKTIEKKAIRN